MAENLKVLVWGHVEEGPCAYFRGHQMKDELLKLGIEYKGISRVNFDLADSAKGMTLPEAFSRGLVKVDAADVDWADVVVFRRYYNTTLHCLKCQFVTFDYVEAANHEHGPAIERDVVTRLLWPTFQHGAHGKAIIYETDDDHFNIKAWNGYIKDVIPEQQMIEEMAKRADLLTTSTDVIAKRYARFNDDVRVIRNAIDPALYERTAERPDTKTRMVYYGSSARMRDYMGYPDSLKPNKIIGGYGGKAVQDFQKDLQRVFIGMNEGTEAMVLPAFDEVHPYVENIPEFCKVLANSWAEIGIAPLGGDEFDRAKSELHWMEYSVAGAAFIGERFRGDGPYGMVREGIDGLLARGRQEWHDAIKSLVKNPNLRLDLAAAAKERVLKEYNYKDRAKEWADAFRWAAENRGKKVRVA
jgi:glycosyltransferase involved in cell wall biosynthesis